MLNKGDKLVVYRTRYNPVDGRSSFPQRIVTITAIRGIMAYSACGSSYKRKTNEPASPDELKAAESIFAEQKAEQARRAAAQAAYVAAEDVQIAQALENTQRETWLALGIDKLRQISAIIGTEPPHA